MNFEERSILIKKADPSEANWGRLEIELAEQEMPGLIQLREEYKDIKPLQGTRICGSLSITVQTAVFLETLKILGAEIRCCYNNFFSSQDHAVASLVESGLSQIFAFKGQTREEFWWSFYQILLWPDNQLANMIVDDGAGLVEFVYYAAQAEEKYQTTGKIPELLEIFRVDDIHIFECYPFLIQMLPQSNGIFIRTAKSIVGVAEQTTSGIIILTKSEKEGRLFCPVMNVNDSATKCFFDNLYGLRHSTIDGILRATDIMIAGKKVVVCGFGYIGKGTARAMKEAGARVFITEIDPICALQACMEGFSVVKIESALDADIFVSATGNFKTITLEHMTKMKNNAIVCNVGCDDKEIDVDELNNCGFLKKVNIKPLVDRYIFPDGHGIICLCEGRIVNLGLATGNPSFSMSFSFSLQSYALIDLWTKNDYKNVIYSLPKIYDEKVAKIHLDYLGAELTQLTDSQSIYLGISKTGPFKKDSYRY